MIAKIELEYAQRCDKQWLSHICCTIMTKCHYISCSSKTKDCIIDAINNHASSYEKEQIKSSSAFDPTNEQIKYMTTINLSDFNEKQCLDLFEKSSLLLIENAPYEWDVYKQMAAAYTHDRSHGNLYKQLIQAIETKKIEPWHGGGFTQYKSLIEQKSTIFADEVIKYKLCALLDSDGCLIEKKDTWKAKRNIYCFLCNIEKEKFTDFELDKIYSLDQKPYIWHMWYKRAIENYFPRKAFEDLGLDLSNYSDKEDWNYIKFKNFNYKKEQLPELSKSMSQKDYETGLQHFCIQEEDLSEIQLLLLKLIKII